MSFTNTLTSKEESQKGPDMQILLDILAGLWMVEIVWVLSGYMRERRKSRIECKGANNDDENRVAERR